RPLRDILGDTVIAITGDHSTPCSIKEHSGDSVPITFVTDGIRKDGVRFYDEISALKGELRITSNDTMNYLLGLSDRAEKYGA
ncbi:MAG TPA: phosphoglycerate mutase, partial [Thermoplasmataceae archaeon]|nr:phosphoglycerate mutase [Thermoplasmataceae archaeon]